MTKLQARRLLLVALAVSLLVHVLIASRITWPFGHVLDAVQVERIEHIHIMRVAKQATPPPQTPPPRATPHPAASAHPRPLGTGGTGQRVIASAATPVPTPVASATPSCFKNDTIAAITQKPDADADLPASVRALAIRGSTSVLVKLDKTGAVTDTSVTVSSGNGSLDLAAVGLARKAIYAPATHACKGIASEITFIAQWSPW